MAITLQNIVDTIEGLTIVGPVEEKIYEVCLWKEGQTVEPGVLYLLPGGEVRPDCSDISLAFLPSNKIAEIEEKIEDLLRLDYRQSVKLLQLQMAVMRNASAEEIARLCRDIMGNPVWLLNRNMGYLAYAGMDKKTLSGFSARRYMAGVGDEPLIVRADKANHAPFDYVASRICNTNKVIGYIMVIGLEQEIEGSLEMKYVQDICSVLANWEYLNSVHNTHDDSWEFVIGLLEGRLTDPVEINQYKSLLNWPSYEKYYVLSIDCGPDEHSRALQQEIRELIQWEVYLYGRYYVSIIGCSLGQRLDRDSFKGLIPFLQKNAAVAGLSGGYVDLAQTRTAMSQSLDSMKTRSLFTAKQAHFCRYEDRILAHFLQLAELHGESLLTFCDPSVIALLEQDNEKGTENFKTFATFVLSQMKLKETAERLYVHRNTIYKRVTQLKEQYGFDFEDSWEVAKMQLSVLIIGYLGLADLSGYAELPQISRHIPEALA